jgi:hypothetical protein
VWPFEILTRKLRNQVSAAGAPLGALSQKQLLLQARMLADQNREKRKISSLADVEFQVSSQWGEDGIIDWLVSALPDIPKSFIEFGVENYSEANTRFLLELRNWAGLILDGSAAHMADVKEQSIYWRHQLSVVCAFIDSSNINALIEQAGFKGEIGLLSVDIDGNDYWVWNAISVVNPVIVVAEYNAVFGDIHAVSVPYKPDFVRTKAHYSNLYFGASLPALIHVAQQKGYKLVGTNSAGCNAFFVRNDHADAVLRRMEATKIFPSKFRESRDAAGKLTYVSGAERSQQLANLPVVLVNEASNNETSIAELGELLSSEWQRGEARSL